MSRSHLVRRALLCGVVAASGGMALTPSATAVPAPLTAAVDPAPVVPVADPSPPDDGDVEDARGAADAAQAEVDEITARLEAAEKRLTALQTEVAEAVSAQELAEEASVRAAGAADEAAAALARARAVREDADHALSGHAALMYMQGGDLQELTTMLVAPPNAMSDASFVLDRDARAVRDRLEAARSAAADAAVREARLSYAQDERAAALEKAESARRSVAAEAEKASAEAAELGRQQEELTARLEELQQDADDLATAREAAARSSDVTLLGLQGEAAPGTAPRAAQELARPMVAARGWDDDEFDCLVTLWHHESGWSWSATNPSSGAYGIPQALPGWKMASAGDDWLTNPATQIAWGLGYIESVYGSPCGALSAFDSRSPHWY